MRNVVRAAASLATVGLYTAVDRLFINEATIVTGERAVNQLQDADQPVNQTILQTLSGAQVPSIVLLGALGAIWYKPIKNLISSNKNIAGSLLVASAVATSSITPAYAYYDTKDYPEYVEILPNQTAFAIPEQGANRSGQAAFMSEQYLTDNKVAMKRFQIPHTLIRNPGWSWDYYVPATKLLVVDRAPYMREWIDDSDRGTSAKKEGFRVESGDSINIDFGVTISASVAEENAARFVYHFGARPIDATRSNDPATTFASVIEARSLANVMDTNVRGKVQAALAREFGKRSTDDCIHQKADIMAAVEKDVKETFAPDGITIDYIGFDTALTFENPEIQKAIDSTIINQRKAIATASLASAIPVLQAQADIDVKESLASLSTRWNGQLPNLPTVMLGSSELTNMLTKLVDGVSSRPTSSSAGSAPAVATPH